MHCEICVNHTITKEKNTKNCTTPNVSAPALWHQGQGSTLRQRTDHQCRFDRCWPIYGFRRRFPQSLQTASLLQGCPQHHFNRCQISPQASLMMQQAVTPNIDQTISAINQTCLAQDAIAQESKRTKIQNTASVHAPGNQWSHSCSKLSQHQNAAMKTRLNARRKCSVHALGKQGSHSRCRQ